MRHTVLLIDDEPDILLYLTKALEEHGVKALSATDTAAALEILMKSRPDLVCLDIMMPRGTGISLYERMRKDPDLARTPVLFMSGAVPAHEFDLRSFLPDAAIPPPEGYFEKPVSIPAFVKAILGLLGNGEKKDRAGEKSHG
jgi:CheY-like chemotaxis protein